MLRFLSKRIKTSYRVVETNSGRYFVEKKHLFGWIIVKYCVGGNTDALYTYFSKLEDAKNYIDLLISGEHVVYEVEVSEGTEIIKEEINIDDIKED